MSLFIFMKFLKYSANGNDFILFDSPSRIPGGEEIQRLCDRHFGIGADGVLILSVDKVSTRMRIFNSDGKEAEMCANGLRSAFTYLAEKKRVLAISTCNGLYTATLNEGRIQVEMTEVNEINGIRIEAPGFLRSFYVSTGVPHIVLLTDSITVENFPDVIRPYRHLPELPKGANVNLVEIPSTTDRFARVRTFERGVEGETLSCGTGLTATALALQHWFGWTGDIRLETRGGHHVVSLGEKILFTGEVSLCFEGEVNLE